MALAIAEPPSLKVEHADPVDTWKPSLSSLPTKARFSKRGRINRDVFHNRGLLRPINLISGKISFILSSKSSRYFDNSEILIEVSTLDFHALHAASIEG